MSRWLKDLKATMPLSFGSDRSWRTLHRMVVLVLSARRASRVYSVNRIHAECMERRLRGRSIARSKW